MEQGIFTVRPKMFSGESLWSYLFRLSVHNGVPLLGLLNTIKTWQSKYVQRADLRLLDLAPGSVVRMDELCKLTGRPVSVLLGTTFYPLLCKFAVSEDVERARFLSGMVLDTYRFCPVCLKEAQYYRLMWRMAPVVACVQHGAILIDKCPSCFKEISFKDVEWLDECPYCKFSLTGSKVRLVTESERDTQSWINEALQTLCELDSHRIKSEEVVMRLLYLLCGRQPLFDRKLAEVALPSVLPTLLQHARDTLHQKRTLHLSFLLTTLHEHRLSMNEFFQTTIPDSFVESVAQGVVRRSDQLSCSAPWCDGYRQPGTLVPTGTTLKRRKTGETLLYYLACTECGCEYAIDENGGLQERTYFIEGYQALKEVDNPLGGIKELARSIGFTEDKTRRCLAYFCTRLEPDDFSATQPIVDVSLLELVLGDIRNGTKLKTIRQWQCWESYQQFLVYRFHPEVMQALIELTRPRPSKRSDSAIKRERVREVLDVLLETDEDITISTVCHAIGACPESIRNWGCNADIARAKEIQKKRRFLLMKKRLLIVTDEYLDNHQLERVQSDNLYDYLMMRRTVLWRTAPEVARYISERLKLHNQKVTRHNP